MLTSMPYSPNCCDDCERHELEVELRDLWAIRSSLVRSTNGAVRRWR